MVGKAKLSKSIILSISNPPRSGNGLGDHHNTILFSLNLLAYSISTKNPMFSICKLQSGTLAYLANATKFFIQDPKTK